MPALDSTALQPLFTFVLGSALLLAALAQHRHQARLEREGEVVRGIVFRLERDRNSYFPVVRFLTRKQEWITVRYHIGSKPASYAEGEEVDIRYNPANPHDFTIVSADSTVMVWLLGLVGSFLLLYSVANYFGN